MFSPHDGDVFYGADLTCRRVPTCMSNLTLTPVGLHLQATVCHAKRAKQALASLLESVLIAGMYSDGNSQLVQEL